MNAARIAIAIGKLDDGHRGRIENDFREIESIASERGLQALYDEANWHIRKKPDAFGLDADLRQRLSPMLNGHARAMWIFLNRPDYWHGAMRFFQADDLGPSQWHKRRDLGKASARVDIVAAEELGQALGSYFHEAHGRGPLCAVEILRRGEVDYFFCFAQGASEAPHAWVNGRLGRQPIHKARDVIFNYSQGEVSLDTYARGGAQEVADVEAIFAKVILGQPDLPPAPKDNRVYMLNVLRSSDFQFQFTQESEIEDVVVRSMRFSREYGEKPNLIIEGDYAANPRSVYEQIDALGDKLDGCHVTKAEIAVHFTPTSAKQNRYVKGTLTHPNKCTFRNDGLDLVARKMLKESGLELQDPES